MNAYELTAAEYVEQRIARAGVDRDVFLDAYPLDVLSREYLEAIRQTPREYAIRLDIYDALPAAIQSVLYKFNFGLRDRLQEREEQRREVEHAPISAALANIRPRIEALKAKRNAKRHGELNKADAAQLARLEAAARALDSPFDLYANKLLVANRYTR